MNDTTPSAAANPRHTAPPPTERVAMLRWMRENLFNSPINSMITVIIALFLVFALPDFIQWALFQSVWSGDHEACRAATGACWQSLAKNTGRCCSVSIHTTSTGG